MKTIGKLRIAGALSLALMASGAMAQQRELKIAYQPNPIQDASIAMMEKWGAKNNVKIVKVPNSYGVYVEKMTASLQSKSQQYDVIWNNDDWGQLWAHLLEPMDDVPGLKLADPFGMDRIFDNAQGKPTTVPMGHTGGVFFYRTDLVKESELPKTWADVVRVSQKLQREGKVKFGYVGGMAMNNSWFSWLWTVWSNGCDLMEPMGSRDNAVLAKAGWKPAITEPCMRQVAEFWWDALHKDKIIPGGMPSYDRNEANAVFTAGDAAFTVADSVFWGTFNDPSKSKIAGKVGMAFFPLGPSNKGEFSWADIWGWSIPLSVPADHKKLAKQMLSDMMSDEAGQVELWKKTGAPPPNKALWDKIAKDDPVMRQMKKVMLDVKGRVHSAYYFAKWPAVHQAYSDAMIKAVLGKREDIPKTLAESAEKIHNAAVK